MLFSTGHVSRVFGLELADGRLIVVKVRTAAQRIAGCVAVQRHLFARGFPCPEPLAGPAPIGSAVATAEAYLPGGEPPGPESATPATFAELLARLVCSAPAPATIPMLEPAPSWVGWSHNGIGIWPHPDDLDIDLNEQTRPDWIDAIGARLRARLSASPSAMVVGHADWESHNIRWAGPARVSVDDWDSVAALPEAAVAGAAAAVFPATPDGRTVAATVEETAAFLDAYQVARGSWTKDEAEICWAAGLWVLTYNAKKETRGGGTGYVEHLERDWRDRIRRSGA
jgi:Phosphotransferase enzyme family